eukprot:1172979-Prorocentrum_minimum.AAC.1
MEFEGFDVDEDGRWSPPPPGIEEGAWSSGEEAEAMGWEERRGEGSRGGRAGVGRATSGMHIEAAPVPVPTEATPKLPPARVQPPAGLQPHRRGLAGRDPGGGGVCGGGHGRGPAGGAAAFRCGAGSVVPTSGGYAGAASAPASGDDAAAAAASDAITVAVPAS